MIKNGSSSFTILCLLTTVFLMASSFNIQTVKASGTIYIRADGSIDPPTANIATANNVTYTFTSNINESIIVKKSDITIDGKGHMLHGLGDGIGFNITDVNNVTIQNTEIQNFDYCGIYVSGSSDNTISGNNITNNEDGIWLYYSSGNTISGNNITNNNFNGIKLYYSSDNTIYGNNITNNNFNGIWLHDSSNNNTISGNNITNNNFNGIYLSVASNNNTISGNNITANSVGIDLYVSSDNTISGNTITNNNYRGIELSGSSGNTISGNTITNNYDGIYLFGSSGNTISGNNITNNNYDGIYLFGSSDNTISGNNITNNNNYGIYLFGFYLFGYSDNNTISGNNVANNVYGIWLSGASYNIIFHNNFVNNTQWISDGATNVWDNGFEGNYWSDYAGSDLDNDGIGDFPYVLDANNTDNHPLMGMFSEFNATPKHDVQTICNSTISTFNFNGTAISFDVSGENGTNGFCRIYIPRALMNVTYTVFVNGTEVPYTLLPCSNSTHSYVYFNYSHSTQEVTIIPEFPSLLILPVFMIAALLAAIVYRRRHELDSTKE